MNKLFKKNLMVQFKQTFLPFHLLLAIIALFLTFSCNSGQIPPETGNRGSYTVHFYTNASSLYTNITTSQSSQIIRPIDPIREHYALEGWYTEPTFVNKYNFDNSLTNDFDLYARWTNKQYRISFYINGISNSSTPLPSLSVIPEDIYPTPNPNNVYIWYTDGGLSSKYNTNSILTNDLSIYTLDNNVIKKNIENIINARMTPDSLNDYDELSKTIFSNYTVGAKVTARYVKTDGSGDGTSWENAADDLRPVINGITNASSGHIYVVLIASGTYKPTDSYNMKNHVTIIGGFTANTYNRSGETRLDGNGERGVFYNYNQEKSALLYGLTIANGNTNNGGGMYNQNSSPTLIGVTFSSNTANTSGGGMYNNSSSPTLIEITFSGNSANFGGGMVNNENSSPALINVTFSGNTAIGSGGGMYNYKSSPTLNGVTFSTNTANGNGGGMVNNKNSSPLLNGVTFSTNTANGGGGMYNQDNSSPNLNGGTFSGNSANFGGGMVNNENSSPTLNGVTFSANSADQGGGIYNEFSSLTLSNIDFSANTANSNGGGMYNKNLFFSSLIEVTFSANTANDEGGGMYNNNSSPNLSEGTFSKNIADRGGGMYNNNSFPILKRGTFSDNSANDEGGGMYNNNSSPNLSEGTFSKNIADRGGGMYNNNSFPNLGKGTFSSNTANSDGGGMYNLGSSPNLSGVTFSANSANGWGGGMVNNNNSSPSLNGITFSANTVNNFGGGMVNGLNSSPFLNGVTFSANTAGKWGGGMYNWDDSSLILVGVTFSANEAELGGGMFNGNSSPTLINALIWGNSGGSRIDKNISGEEGSIYYSLIEGRSADPVKGIINTDPSLQGLVDNGGEVLTHALPSESSAENTGVYVKGVKTGNSYTANNVYYSTDNATWYRASDGESATPPGTADDLTATDARGYARVGRPDIGAYEVGGNP